MKIVDCCGLNCPEPVLRTKSALSETGEREVTVIVDNETARENVLRYARSQGRTVEWHEKEGLYHLDISGQGKVSAEDNKTETDPNTGDEPVLFFATEQLGTGSSELGEMLMRNFIYTLTKRESLPKAMVFMNSGVKLCIKGASAIEELEFLEQKKVLILVCGTCLDYYNLKEAHKVGQVSNMYDIADLLLDADRVVTV